MIQHKRPLLTPFSFLVGTFRPSSLFLSTAPLLLQLLTSAPLLGQVPPLTSSPSATSPSAPAPLECSQPLSIEAQRLLQIASDPEADRTSQAAALKALKAMAPTDSVCGSVQLLCEGSELSAEARNWAELALVDLLDQALPILAQRLNSNRCSKEATAAMFARVARRTPDVLPALCQSTDTLVCAAAASGLAVSGYPSTEATLLDMYSKASSTEAKSAVIEAACPVSPSACKQMLAGALAKDSPRPLVLQALGALRQLRSKELNELLGNWLQADDPQLLLAVLETLADVGCHGLEQPLFDLLPAISPALKDPVLMAMASGDTDTVRPLLQRAFAAAPPSTPEQRRVAQWLLADSPDVLFRGNSPETTPIYASAQPATPSVCRLTLRSLEGMRVAVDGKLRLICPDSSSRTLAFEHTSFREDGTIEFPCLCPDGSRPQATWITLEETLLEVQWKKQP